jgi:hypothetical protein
MISLMVGALLTGYPFMFMSVCLFLDDDDDEDGGSESE